jgi:hypothetical protein
MAAKAIEIEGLTKDYATGFWRKRRRRALENVSFAVESGEVCGFLGPNGPGKTTTLDPHLIVAYKFGAVFLAQAPPQGAGRPDLAVKLIHRGIAENPAEWRLWADLGFVYYWDLRDFKKAAEAYLEGSRHAGASPWMKTMAAQLAEQGGSRQVSSFLWAEIYKTTTHQLIRENALEHVQALKAEDNMEHIQRVVAEFHGRYKRAPQSIGELVTAGLLQGYPGDPAGFPYALGPGAKPMLNPASPINLEILKPPALR